MLVGGLGYDGKAGDERRDDLGRAGNSIGVARRRRWWKRAVPWLRFRGLKIPVALGDRGD